MSDIPIIPGKKDFIEEESWLRQPGETNAAFHAFCIYRDYGGDRTIRKAITAEGLPERRINIWRAWSNKYQWKRRSTDYDNHLEKIKREERETTFREREQQHLKVTGKMLDLVEKRLDRLDPEELSQGTLTDWVKTSVNIERQTYDDTIEDENKGKLKQLEISFFEEFDGI
ncbi:MAG: hypothetical protein PQJ61_17320 [Spirochaetales bacterium]|uniref:Uncharacterized protein n=1 Tax=Candidatus Thalassospirochaeta sargassi TaxID=3119039 RepID=A0AAJ1IK12_9SPIO|nr:hypothetical protein [Spirochaetales bacterium]